MKFKMNGTKMEISGNEVSGDTYENRQWLKGKMDGEWDADRRVWIVNAPRLKAFLARKPWLIIDEEEEESQPEQKAEPKPEKKEKSADTQGLRNLILDGSLPSEEEMIEQIWNEANRAEEVPYGRN